MRPRIRTIKPEVFHDERLWALFVETGMPVLQGFAGLWCYADREGRFEWRPAALKSLILPYWTGDFEELLRALALDRFIVRYEVDGRAYGLVRKFKDHQQVNAREPASLLPAPPPEPECTVTHVHNNAPHGYARVEGKGREGIWNGKGREGSDDPAPDSSPEVITQILATQPPPAAPPKSSPRSVRPEQADGAPVTWHTLKDWLPPASLEDEALMANISREYFRERIKRAQNKPIGGRDGVFSREQWVRDQFPFWVVDQRTQQPRAGPRRGSAQQDHGVDPLSFHRGPKL